MRNKTGNERDDGSGGGGAEGLGLGLSNQYNTAIELSTTFLYCIPQKPCYVSFGKLQSSPTSWKEIVHNLDSASMLDLSILRDAIKGGGQCLQGAFFALLLSDMTVVMETREVDG